MNIKGSAKRDVLFGTAGNDRIQGLAGNDDLYGYDGNDTIEAGAGDDFIVPGAGSDTIDGGLGIDTLDYSSWSGPIRLSFSGYSTDTKGFGKVEEYGSGGVLLSTDQFSYIENVVGTAFADLMYGGGGANSLWGGAGNDHINGGNGNDQLFGGAGNDLIDVGNGNDYADGGDGIDTLFWEWSGLAHAVVDLQTGRIDYPAYGSGDWDIVLNFENVRGRDGNKQIFGTDGTNIVQGSAGSDLIDGRGGDDVLAGDFGRITNVISNYPYGYDDEIRGGDGSDLISGDEGDNILTGGAGADRFVFDSNGGNNHITDFEDGTDSIWLYGGLQLVGWERRDSDGDGFGDSQAALLSNGTSILFEGHADAPASLLGGAGMMMTSDHFAIPELTIWP